MKFSKYILFAAAAFTMAACSDDDPAVGNPKMDVKTSIGTAYFGDSLRFTINASDPEVALSTIHADLFFGDECVSSQVVRTKVSGQDYECCLYVPYFANVPDGNATLKLYLQNINFTKTEMEYSVAISHADYPYLTFVSDNDDNAGEEYRMERQSQYVYAFTQKLPQKMKGYIKAPSVGDNGNEMTWGYASGAIALGGESSIPFSNSKAGKYTIEFNTYTFAGSPFVVLSFDGNEFQTVDDSTAQLDINLTQGQTITPEGFPNIEEWWIDPDFFTDNGDGTFTFVPITGYYRIIADQSKNYFRVYQLDAAGAAQTLSETDGSGALWVIGAGIGKPNLNSEVGWTTENALCMSQISDRVYQITGVAGKQLGTSSINFKFFGQMGWGIELGGSNYAAINSDLVRAGGFNGDSDHDSGNLYLLDGASLQENTIYRFVVDLTGGFNAAVLSVYADGEAPEETFTEKKMYLNDAKFETSDNISYTLTTQLSQGQEIEISGAVDAEDFEYNCDYFTKAADGTITFNPVTGYYKIMMSTTGEYVNVTRVSADGGDSYDDCHAMYILGWGVGFPSQSNQNGWSFDDNKLCCMAEISENVFQWSGYVSAENDTFAGAKIRQDYLDMKIFGNKSWGDEYNSNNCEFVGNTADYLTQATSDGNFHWADGNDLQTGDFATITLDLTGGKDNPKITFTKK